MHRFKLIFAATLLFLISVCTVSAQVNIINTVAGGGTQNNISAVLADFPLANGVAVDSAGNVYISSELLHQVFKVDTSGKLVVLAGTGICGSAGDGDLATSASLCYPQQVAVDGSGNVFIADSNNNRIRRVDATTKVITTVAGSGASSGGDGGPAINAGLLGPYGVAVDSSGDLYIADSYNNRIRRVDAATQYISTVAGNGTPGFSGDNGAATNAELKFPTGIGVDSSGDLYIADTNNERIRRVDATSHNITTVAGNGQTGFNGDGNSATSTSLCSPFGVALDASDAVFVADLCSSRIRRVDPNTQTVATVAGDTIAGFTGDGSTATSAELNYPDAVAIDHSGNLFIADGRNGRIRRVDAQTTNITTIAGGGTGGDNAAATSAILATPTGLAVDASGNLLIADNYNNRIRRVDANTKIITTIAGNGIPGYSGSNIAATLAELWQPWGIALDGSGNLFIADSQNFRIRVVDALTQTITTLAGNGFAGYSGDGNLATGAELSDPIAVALDNGGNLFIGDAGTDPRVRRVDAATSLRTQATGRAATVVMAVWLPARRSHLHLG